MPAAIAWGIALIGAEIGSVVLMMYATEIATAAIVLGGLAYSSAKAKQAKQQARDQYNAAQVNRMVNVVSSVTPRELVLGRVRKGGAVFYKASTGTVSRNLYLCIALAGHEIDAIEQIYLNDVPVTLDVDGQVLEEPYWYPPSNASYVRIYQHLGGADQVADPHLLAAFPEDWSSTNTVAGVAYLVVHLFYSETAFPSGVPNVTAVVRGAKLFDPRHGTTAWSENPALMMRHVYAHPRFGKAAPTNAEEARFIAAANACDTSVAYTVGSVAQPTCALYRAGIVAPFGTQAKSLLDDLSQAMGGSWAFAGGELYLKPGVYSAPVLTLTDADLAVVQRTGASESQKPISIGVHKERAQKFNTVKATIWDAAQDYKQTVLTDLVGAALVTRDGVPLVQEVTLPAVGYAPQALHICGIMMRDARDALVLDLPVKLRAYPLELFDTISLTLSRYGWSTKAFMVLGRTWNADGSIQLTLKETAAAITQMDSGFLPQGYAANTNLPNPWRVGMVGPLTVSSGAAEMLVQSDGSIISRMRVSWPQINDAAVVQNGQIEVQYRAVGSTGPWASLVTAGNETTVITSNVQAGTSYTVRARGKTSIAVGEWSSIVTGAITGKTSAPAAVTAQAVGGMFMVQLTWAFGDSAIDILGTEIWWSSTNNRTAASRLSYEPYPGTSYQHIGLSAGQGGYYWLRVGNTSGVMSAWYPSGGTNGLYAVASSDPSSLLAQLFAAIGVNQLTAGLASSIGEIPEKASVTLVETKITNAQLTSATSINAVSARLDSGDFAAVKTESSATATAAALLKARYTIKLSVNGYVSGYESVNDGVTSSFVVLADKFLIARPDGSGTPKPMMVIGTVNGTTALGIDGNLIIDGTIAANRIDTRGLSIKDGYGNVILSAGVGLPSGYVTADSGWLNSNVTYAGLPDAKPPTNATNGATFGVNIAGQITAANASTYIAAAAIANAHIGNAAIDTLQVAGQAITAPMSALSGFLAHQMYGGSYGTYVTNAFQTSYFYFSSNEANVFCMVQLQAIGAVLGNGSNVGVTARLALSGGGSQVIFDTNTSLGSGSTDYKFGFGSIQVPHAGWWRIEIDIRNDWNQGMWVCGPIAITCWGAKK